MKTQRLLLTIYLDGVLTDNDLNLRQLLVITIEDRALGNVIEETSSADVIEVVLEGTTSDFFFDKIKSLMDSLGFSKYDISDITNENE